MRVLGPQRARTAVAVSVCAGEMQGAGGCAAAGWWKAEEASKQLGWSRMQQMQSAERPDIADGRSPAAFE